MNKFAAIALFSLAAFPVSGMAAIVAEIDGFGSYLDASTDGPPAPGNEPSGSGGGLRARINLPVTGGLFLTGESQRNSLSDGGTDFDLTGGRAGIGSTFELGPISFLGRAEFVHFLRSSAGAEDNDDGFGVHIGATIDMVAAGLYGSVGAVKLSDAKGPEILVGVNVSLAPFFGLFGEYRYTSLHTAFGTNRTLTVNDYRVGVRFSL